MKSEDKKNWSGYTYDELKFRQIVVDTKVEIAKAELVGQFKQATSPKNAATALLTKVVGAFNYVDYALLAFRLGKKLITAFKK